MFGLKMLNQQEKVRNQYFRKTLHLAFKCWGVGGGGTDLTAYLAINF